MEKTSKNLSLMSQRHEGVFTMKSEGIMRKHECLQVKIGESKKHWGKNLRKFPENRMKRQRHVQ
jgi:hypothetical protein